MFNDEILKHLENYQNAEEVDIDKAIGNDPICFTEYTWNNGVKTEIKRKALPVLCSRLSDLRQLHNELSAKREELSRIAEESRLDTVTLSIPVITIQKDIEKISVELEKEMSKKNKINFEKTTNLQDELNKKTDEAKKVTEDLRAKQKALIEIIEPIQAEVQGIQLKIAQLVFSRAEGELPVEKLQGFLDPQQLNMFEYIAFGQSIPPNALPGKIKMKKR